MVTCVAFPLAEVSWASGLVVVAGVSLPWWGGLRQLTRERALTYTKVKKVRGVSAPDPASGTLAALDGEGAITFGTHESGRPLKVQHRIAHRNALILGASGAGKSFGVVAILKALIVAMVLGLSFEIEVVDVKNESVDLLRRIIGGWLLTWPENKKEWLRRHVRVFSFSKERVTPLRPYDNVSTAFTNAYAARYRTSVTTNAGTAEYTDITRHERSMLDRVLMELRWPLSYRATVLYTTDVSFQSFLASRVRDGHLRARLQSLHSTMTKQTGAALCRRVEEEVADPLIRAAKATPPSALDGLLPVQEPGLTLSRVGPDQSLQADAAQELALMRYFDLIASIPTRRGKPPLLVVAEELAESVADSPRLVRPVTKMLRLSRSYDVALWALAQDFENAAQRQLATAFALGARFIVAYQSIDEAEWLAPHLPSNFEEGASDAERRRAAQIFQREIEGLPEREFFFYAKGHPVLRCRSLDLADPASEVGRSNEELEDVFDREIGSRSTITLAKAEELIAAWEAEVLDRREAPPAPEPKAGSPFKSMDDVYDYFDDDEGEPDA